MIRQRQLPSLICSTESVNMPTDKIRINVPFQMLISLPPCVIALYAKNDQAIKEQCSLVISHMPHIFIPIAVATNVWIIPSSPQTLGSTMTTMSCWNLISWRIFQTC